MGGISMYSTN